MDSKKPEPEILWEDDFDNVDKQERFEQFNFDDYVLDHTYELQGDYNWKILADNFNECYHCPTTHVSATTPTASCKQTGIGPLGPKSAVFQISQDRIENAWATCLQFTWLSGNRRANPQF